MAKQVDVKELIKIFEFLELKASAQFQAYDCSDAMHEMDGCKFAIGVIRGLEHYSDIPKTKKARIVAAAKEASDMGGETVVWNEKEKI